jgi:hypothetical protein
MRFDLSWLEGPLSGAWNDRRKRCCHSKVEQRFSRVQRPQELCFDDTLKAGQRLPRLLLVVATVGSDTRVACGKPERGCLLPLNDKREAGEENRALAEERVIS